MTEGAEQAQSAQQSAEQSTQQYLTAHELAALAGTTPNMIHTYIRTGRIKATTYVQGNGREVRGIELNYALNWAKTHKERRQERLDRQRALIDSQLGRR